MNPNTLRDPHRPYYAAILRAMLISLLAWGCGIAWPAEPRESNATRERQQPKTELRGTKNSPLFVEGTVTTKRDKTEADDDAKERESKARSDEALVKYTYWLALTTGALFIAAAIQAGLFVWQLRLIGRSEKQAKEVAESAKASAIAAKTSADAVMLSERAYVTASIEKPGLKMNNEIFEISVSILNHGHTPASVSNVVIDAVALENGEPLVEREPQNREVVPRAFLVPRDSFPYSRHFPLREPLRSEVTSQAKTLWIFGYVDYTDTFKTRYRYGFARIYVPALDGSSNNLCRSNEGNAWSDYDRLRVKGEGNDWHDMA